MNKYQRTTLLIAISCLLVSGVLSCGFLKVNNVFGQSECIVPTVEFVTEYQNDRTYQLSDGFEGFIVKQWNPNLSVEYFEQNSIQLTSAMNNSSGHLTRLWQVKDYQQIDFFVNGSLDLGEIANNTQVDLVLIDNDSFETRIENENQNILTTKQPSFVQYIQFVTTHTGNYSVETEGSIGFAGVCQTETWDKSSIVLEGFCSESGMLHFEAKNHGEDMRGTVPWRMYVDNVLQQSGSVEFLADETFYFDWNPGDLNGEKIRFEIDQRPNHPGNSKPNKTLEIKECHNVLFTPTPTSTPTSTPTNTFTATPTNTATFVPTPTNTVTNTPTPTLTSTPTSTPSPTPTEPPTGLTPEPETQQIQLFIPLVNNGKIVMMSETEN